ncbi:MAG: hypothetical protein L0Z70_10630, partial [Chloroflexi bacterium]|nr:hypothetical protein [Chloroflexota bacterium]
YKTYLCRAGEGDAHPGYEPEVEAAQLYAIAEVRWLDLRQPDAWEAELGKEEWVIPVLKRIWEALGIQ